MGTVVVVVAGAVVLVVAAVLVVVACVVVVVPLVVLVVVACVVVVVACVVVVVACVVVVVACVVVVTAAWQPVAEQPEFAWPGFAAMTMTPPWQPPHLETAGVSPPAEVWQLVQVAKKLACEDTLWAAGATFTTLPPWHVPHPPAQPVGYAAASLPSTATATKTATATIRSATRSSESLFILTSSPSESPFNAGERSQSVLRRRRHTPLPRECTNGCPLSMAAPLYRSRAGPANGRCNP